MTNTRLAYYSKGDKRMTHMQLMYTCGAMSLAARKFVLFNCFGLLLLLLKKESKRKFRKRGLSFVFLFLMICRVSRNRNQHYPSTVLQGCREGDALAIDV